MTNPDQPNFRHPDERQNATSHGMGNATPGAAFGQANEQPPSSGQTNTSGETNTYGQTSTYGQTPSHGQTPSNGHTPSYGQTASNGWTSSAAQTDTAGQTNMYGQTHSVRQRNSADLPSTAGQQPPYLGQDAYGYGAGANTLPYTPNDARLQTQSAHAPYANDFGERNPQSSSNRTASKRTPWAGIIAAAAVTGLIFGGGGAYAATHLAGSDTTTGGTSAIVQGNGEAVDWATVAQQVQASVVSIQVTSGQSGDQGSGVIWDAEGDIVTNNHVVSAAAQGGKITVLIGQNAYEATLVGTDATTDLAVIKIDPQGADLVPLARGEMSSLSVGNDVMAIGNPLGLSGSVTTGIVSALNRPVTTGGTDEDPVVMNAIQTSAALNPGNSGGALVNAQGQLVGINSAIASLSQSQTEAGNIGIGFAIPITVVTLIADQLIQTGTAKHAMLGVTATDGTAKNGSTQTLGAEVKSVTSGAPAEKAGLKVGDVITAIDDAPISSSTSLVGAIRGLEVGKTVSVTVLRDGSEQKFDVTLGQSATN